MAMEPLIYTCTLPADPQDAFYAFGTAQGWREWLCDHAHFTARPGTPFLFHWDNGWYACGKVAEVEGPHRLSLRWQGEGDPHPTTVSISISAHDEGSHVQLEHGGFGQGEAWEGIRDQARRGWEMGFENLQSIFTSGEDLRQVRRPMLGIMLSDFNAKIAQQLGLPISEGVRVGGVIDGMGAARAGLKADDVIVEMAGQPVKGFPDLGRALADKRAGQRVAVTLYRGQERLTLEMELSQRPFAQFPLDPAAIAARLEAQSAEIMESLRRALEGVTEAEAEAAPAPGEWSAKEVLAHLIEGEAYTLNWLVELYSHAEREFLEEGASIPERLHAITATTPSIEALLERYQQAQAEVVYFLRHADKFKAHNGTLWRLGQALLQFPGQHEKGHIEQIIAAIQAARRA